MKWIRNTLFIILLSGIMAFTTKEKAKHSKVPSITHQAIDSNLLITLGHSQFTGGMISKTLFDSLALQGLQLVDSTAGWNIQKFTFTYAERGIYEDSIGNPLIMADYISQPCSGKYLNQELSHDLIVNRTKAGDTAYFESIVLMNSTGKKTTGKAIRCILKK